MIFFNPKNWKIRQKILGLLLFLSLGTISLISIQHYVSSKNILTQQLTNQLIAIREGKSRAIQTYLEQCELDLTLYAQNLSVIDGFDHLARAFHYLQVRTDSLALPVNREPVAEYYQTEFFPRLYQGNEQSADLGTFLPRDPVSLYLQEHYIAKNPYPTGKKDELNTVGDSSLYGYYHEKFHPIFRDFQQRTGYYDLFLVNLEGFIIYTVFKEVDFGTNLLDGPYAQTGIGEVFKTISQSNGEQAFVMSDFQQYPPSYGAPAAFIATPITIRGKFSGVLILQMPITHIDQILTSQQRWEQEGLGKTGDTYLVGNDGLLRSNVRKILENKAEFLTKLTQIGVAPEQIGKIDRYQTTILQLPIQAELLQNSKALENALATGKNYLGQRVMATFTDLTFSQLQWKLIIEIEQDEALSPIHSLRNSLLFTTLFCLIVVVVSGTILSKSISRPLRIASQQLQNVALGILPDSRSTSQEDEAGDILNAVHKLTTNQKRIVAFAQQIGSGDFQAAFQPRSSGDLLGKALLHMRDELLKNDREEEKRAWANEGLSFFLAMMRKHNDLGELSNEFLSELVNRLGAMAGAIYLLDGEGDNATIYAKSTFAYGRKRAVDIRFGYGEGLVGETIRQQAVTLLTEIPNDYLTIRSGLGESKPKAILIVPVRANGEALGAIEIASFHVFEPYQIDFLEKLGENFASMLASAYLAENMKRLYEESKSSTNDLLQRDEEMRQQNEELMAMHEEYARKERFYQQEIERLRLAVGQ